MHPVAAAAHEPWRAAAAAHASPHPHSTAYAPARAHAQQDRLTAHDHQQQLPREQRQQYRTAAGPDQLAATPATDSSALDSASPASRSHPSRARNLTRSKTDTAVISSIISSLDTLETSPVPFDADSAPGAPISRDRPRYRPDGRRRSPSATSQSSLSTSRSFTRRKFTPGRDVGGYGIAVAPEEDRPVTASTLASTSTAIDRPPRPQPLIATPNSSAWNNYSAPLSRSRPNSRGSSLSGTSTQAERQAGRNKLSSESWVRKTSPPEEEPVPDTPRGRTPRKSLRRVSSQESLRPGQASAQQLSSPPPPPSLAAKDLPLPPPIPVGEHIVSRSPSQFITPRERIVLVESPVEEKREILLPSPTTPESQRAAAKEPASPSPAAIVPSPPKQLTPPRMVPGPSPSPISDSIPTRTSSLRQASSSPASTKRTRKPSKKSTSTSTSTNTNTNTNMSTTNGAMTTTQSVFAPRRSKPIPESSWADLGEDDETVKRIRELRILRESRLKSLEAQAESSSPPLPPDTVNGPTAVTDLPGRKSVETNTVHRLSRIQPNRAFTEPVGVPNLPNRTPSPNIAVVPWEGLIFPPDRFDPSPRENYSLDVKRPYASELLPAKALSDSNVTPTKLSLDYSYTDAVDVLRFAEGDEDGGPPARGTPSRERSASPVHPRFSATQVIPLTPVQPAKSKRGRPDIFKFATSSSASATAADLERKKSRRRSLNTGAANNAGARAAEPSPARRDSLDAQVTEYLAAPRLSRFLYNPIGKRTIAYSEVGDPHGAVVFVCVGMGLTRYVTAFYDELATTLRLRLITLDRPGVGGSDPYPPGDKSGPLNWPEDVLAVCQELGITKFSLLAHSAGALYALATALIFPQMVTGKIHLLAPWIPPSQLAAVPHHQASAAHGGGAGGSGGGGGGGGPVTANALPRSQRFLRALPAPILRAANTSFMSVTSVSLKKTRSSAAGKGADGDDPPLPMPDDPTGGGSGDGHRRESMMLMDRVMPSTSPLDAFPDADAPDGGALKRVTTNNTTPQDPALVLSATAYPTDPSFRFAANGLDAAAHAAQARQRRYARELTARTWTLATRDSHPATDLLVCLERHRPIGFRYTDVSRAVVITHGADDKRVPAANIRWLAAEMNRHAAASAAAAAAARGDSPSLLRRPASAAESMDDSAGSGSGGRRSAQQQLRPGTASPASSRTHNHNNTTTTAAKDSPQQQQHHLSTLAQQPTYPPASRDGWADPDPIRASAGCEVRILPNEGHGLMASPAIVGDVLTEIAGYWVGVDRGYVGTPERGRE